MKGSGRRRILFVSDVRLLRSSDQIYSTHPTLDAETLRPFHLAFGDVMVLARRTEDGPQGGVLNSEGVRFSLLEDYSSGPSFIRALPVNLLRIHRAVRTVEWVHLRVPEPLSILAGMFALLLRRNLLVSVVADPTSMFPDRRGVVPNVARRLVTWASRLLARSADATLYVTKSQLQVVVPPKPSSPTLVRVDVSIEASDIEPPRLTHHDSGQLRVICVASNQTLAKGQQVLLRALKELQSRGRAVSVSFVGGGRYCGLLAREAEALGVAEHVEFTGQLEKTAVLQALDAHDVFCLPSEREGTPRSLVEAMARGLPPVVTRVGGMPDHVPATQLVEAGDVRQLADALERLWDPSTYAHASQDAVERSRILIRDADEATFIKFLDAVGGC